MKKYFVLLENNNDNEKNNNNNNEVLKDISLCFQSEKFRIVEKKNNWILESDDFEICETVDEVIIKANEIISKIKILLEVYCKLSTSLGIKNILWLKDGKYKSRIFGSLSLQIYSNEGVKKLSDGTKASLGSRILTLAQKNESAKELLSLTSEHPFRWHDIYNIIEFMGNDKGVERRGFATKKEVIRIRRTANYYRHLGKQKKDTLPENIPSLGEASDFAKELICKWFDSELSSL